MSLRAALGAWRGGLRVWPDGSATPWPDDSGRVCKDSGGRRWEAGRLQGASSHRLCSSKGRGLWSSKQSLCGTCPPSTVTGEEECGHSQRLWLCPVSSLGVSGPLAAGSREHGLRGTQKSSTIAELARRCGEGCGRLVGQLGPGDFQRRQDGVHEKVALGGRWVSLTW